MSRDSTIILIGYALLHLFSILQSENFLKKHISENKYRIIRPVWMILYIAAASVPVVGAFVPVSFDFRYPLQKAGNIFLGFDLYFCGFLILFSIADLIVKLIKKKGRKERKGLYAWAWIIPVILAAVLPVYGLVHAQQPTVTYWSADARKGSEYSGEMKVVLIADLHLGVNSNPGLMEKTVGLINAENPDLVLIAGDIFNSTYAGVKDPEKYSAALSKITAKNGVYAVYGNHDVNEELFGGFAITELEDAFRLREMEQFVSDCGFTVLRDEAVTLADGRITLVGRVDGERAGDGTDKRKSVEELLADVDKDTSVWVLEHEPWDFQKLYEAGADITFCGHTHNGQIFPVNFFVGFYNDNAYGYKNVNGLDTFVTSGVGYYGPPMRICTDSEVMVINVKY